MSKRISMLLFTVLLVIGSSGCGHAYFYNKKADDSISQAVHNALGDDVYYVSKEERESGSCHYLYLIRKEEKEVLYELVSSINQEISKESSKVYVMVGCEIPGGMEIEVILSNYTDESLPQADYKGLKDLIVRYPNISHNELFKNPEIYTQLEDIHSFEIDRELQDKAVEQGIDWQEIWPNLEKFEIVE